MPAYYNEFEPYCVQWLKNLIAAGLIPAGDVDDRSITEVSPDDLAGYTQHHFFAGLGGWPLAARLAGWPDDKPLFSGSPPCQPYSTAGRQKGFDDTRDLWPDYFALIRSLRPPFITGEEVYAAVRHGWLDRAFTDLEGEGYTCRALGVPACAVNAPHRRDRLWIVACRSEETVADTASLRCQQRRSGSSTPLQGQCSERGWEQAGSEQVGQLPRRTQGLGSGPVANRHGLAGRQVDKNTGWSTNGSGTGHTTGSGCTDDGAVDHAVEPRLERLAGHNEGAPERQETRRSTPPASGHVVVADTGGERRQQESSGAPCHETTHGRQSHGDYVLASHGEGAGPVANPAGDGRQQRRPAASSVGYGCEPATAASADAWSDADRIIGHDGKARRVPPGAESAICGVADGVSAGVDGPCTADDAEKATEAEAGKEVIHLLATGVPARTGKLKALGNAIVPEVAAVLLEALMDCEAAGEPP